MDATQNCGEEEGWGGLQRSCLHLILVSRFSFYLSFPLFLESTGQDGRFGWLFLLLPIAAAFFLALNGDDCLLCLLCFLFLAGTEAIMHLIYVFACAACWALWGLVILLLRTYVFLRAWLGHLGNE